MILKVFSNFSDSITPFDIIMFKRKNYVSGEITKFLIFQADNSNIIIQLKKENEYAHSKVQMWMKSCKQLEQEKEMLQKQLAEHDEMLKKENLTMAKHNKEGN